MAAEQGVYSTDGIRMVPLRKVKRVYFPYVTKVFSERMSRSLQQLTTFDLMLPVEKHPLKDEYILVGRYDCYEFIVSQDMLEAPCFVEPFTNKPTQYAKILRRLYGNGEASKKNRQKVLSKLEAIKVPLMSVMKMAGLMKKDVSDYYYEPDVPEAYRQGAATETTLNWISRLKVSEVVREFLYRRASIPEGNSKRLTNEKCKFLRKFFKEIQGFEMLSDAEQIKILTCALNFSGIIMSFLQEKIDKYLSQ